MLCDDNTLLLLRTDDDDMLMLLHKARRGGFHVSRGDGDTDEVDILSFNQILNIKGGDLAALYYYPGMKVKGPAKKTSPFKI